MKPTILSTMIAVATLASLTNPAYAVYNLYKKDGLSLDINGEVNIYAEQEDISVEGQSLLADIHEDLSDARVRLYPDAGASWLDFRASQTLNNDYRVTGTLGLGYAQGNSGIYLNSANVSLDKLNVGAVTLGRQYLHTGFVTRTGTYTPLDTFGEQAVRLDYYGVPNLHTSAYYLLPSSTDVRSQNDDAETEGFGASISYKLPILDNQSLRLAAGYSNNKANPTTQNADAIAAKSDNYALSAEYRLGKFMVATDFGKKDATMNGYMVSGADSDYLGFKVGYELTPRFNLMAGYGKKDSKRKYTNQIDVADVSSVLQEDAKKSGLAAQMYAPFVFDTLKEQQVYLRGDYYLRENFRIYGQAIQEEVQAKQAGANYAKLEDTSYRLGVSFVF